MKINEKLKDMKLIPLKNNGKIPKVKWGTNDDLPFDGKETGYGVDTGRSKLVVIDCDNKHDDVNGVNNFIELCEKNGGIPDTFTVETPNNGLHFYFKNNTGMIIKNSSSTVLGEGIDVRAWGGYIIGPGSKVKNDDGEIKEYKLESNDSEILELPEWIIKELKVSSDEDKKSTSSIKNKKSSNKTNQENENEDDDFTNKNAIDWAIDKMTNASAGSRNTTLNLTAYFMGRKRVEEEEAKRLIEIAINNGLPKDEAENTFEASYEKGLSEDQLELTVISKEYNNQVGISFKEDPTDSEFYTHVSVAYNFWKRYKEELVFWKGDSSWYGYNKTYNYWQKQDDEYVKSLVKKFFEIIIPEIRGKHVRLPINIYKAQEKMWAKTFIDSVAAVSKWEFTNDEVKLFDSNPYLVNCKNGTYDVTVGKLLPHDVKNYITHYIPYNYEEGFKDKYCEKILESVQEDQREYFQLMAGQALLGEQPISQVMSFMNGKGSNGKTTNIDLLLKSSGTYGKLQSPDILLPTNGKEVYAMADFDGLRTVIVEELPDSKQLNSGAVKRLVGTQQINARPIYGKNRTFDNTSTIFVSCNRLPLVTEFDHGTWRRLIVFSFPYTYRKTKEQVKNEFDRLGDPRVLYAANHRDETIKAALVWRLEGACRWYINKYSENTDKPESMEKTENEWRENNDLLFGFLNENVKISLVSYILLIDLFEAFNRWLAERGNSKVSMRYFVEALQNHEFFTDNKLVYKKTSYVRKDLQHSEWFDPENATKMPRTPGTRPSYVIGIAFK